MEDIKTKNSLESKLQTSSVCSVRILIVLEVISVMRLTLTLETSSTAKRHLALDRRCVFLVGNTMGNITMFLMMLLEQGFTLKGLNVRC